MRFWPCWTPVAALAALALALVIPIGGAFALVPREREAGRCGVAQNE
jgi:hypothetical protein